ncbi:uncharacterized protein N7518_008364 [Penicillium psychrosexuale]|uniref:uncharacterized protein n=1 Tax=Penicillium psychrosexuale TaxID=1002107 RepID=UPI002545A37F|nr:uncharacterized protein N7518_008364 [Penicillium psychrosexuale]KAJ5791353.1 hypothetical protein N7518_008364 [Penicillium psychrosexuale]
MASKPQDPPSWITEDGSPLCGFYWMRIDAKVQPNYWVCPYCTALDNAEKEGRPCPVRVKRHINAAHISDAISTRSEEEVPSETPHL